MTRITAFLLTLVLLLSSILTTGCTPKFRISPVEASPSACLPGETVTISTTITNTGSSNASYSAEFTLGSFVKKNETVTLGAGESKRIEFPVSRSEPGKYSVQFNEMSAEFVVLQPLNLDISPAEVEAGQPVRVIAAVNNVSDKEVTYPVSLLCQEQEIESRDIMLPARSAQDIVFTLSQENAGNYDIELLGLRDSFRVFEPARFEVSELSVMPDTLEAGEQITVTAKVTNTGEAYGTYSGNLEVNGETVDTSETGLDKKSSEHLFYTTYLNYPGTYSIALDTVSATVEVLPSASQIVREAEEVWEDIRTYELETNLEMDIDITEDDESYEFVMDTNEEITVDYDNEKMKLVMEYTIDDSEYGSEEGYIEEYIIGDTLYFRVDIPGASDDWQEESLDDYDIEDAAVMEQQTDILDISSVILKGIEEIDGVECYKLDIEVDTDEFWEILMDSMTLEDDELLDIEYIMELSLLSESLEIRATEWVTRENWYLKQYEFEMDWPLLDIGSFEIEIETTIDKHNKPVKIEDIDI